MFERFTEKARRVIFFARYECSALGSSSMGPEHLMLGLLREGQSTIANHLKMDRFALAERLKQLIPENQQPISTSVDLPLNDAGKRVLDHAAEEAAIMNHASVGTEHLLLGLFREEQGPVAEVLHAVSAPTLAEVRASVTQSMASEDQGRSAPTIYLVDKLTEKSLAVHLSLQALPRIGDSITFDLPGECAVRHRVVDVAWDFQTPSNKIEPRLRAVRIIVRSEDAPAS